jgi:flagellar hook-length control protein FliK
MADRSSTLDMLRRDAPQLQRALQDAGLKTSGDGMQFSLRDQNTNAQSQQQQQQQQNFQNPAATRMTRIPLRGDDVQPVETARSYGRLYGLSGGLDIRV